MAYNKKQRLAEVLRSGILSIGPRIIEFEKRFTGYIGVKHAVAVNSDTSGLHLLIKALGIKEGDEVITTPFSFIASSNCILFDRAKPAEGGMIVTGDDEVAELCRSMRSQGRPVTGLWLEHERLDYNYRMSENFMRRWVWCSWKGSMSL